MRGATLQLATQYRRPAEPTSFGAKLILAVSITVITACSVGYIVQMNIATSKGYEIKKLESTVVQMRAENAKLDANVASMQSMAAAQEKINMMGMVDIGSVEYLTPPGPVAVAR